MRRLGMAAACCVVLAAPTSAFFSRKRALPHPAEAQFDPLEPLTTAEIDAASALLRQSGLFTSSASFLSVELQAPTADEETVGRRRALAVLFDPLRHETSEAVVEVSTRKLISWRIVPDVEPGLTLAEQDRAFSIVRADDRWAKAMEWRGRARWEDLAIEAVLPGPVDPAASDHRLARAYFFARQTDDTMLSVDGLTAVVDLETGKVADWDDAGGSLLPLPPTPPPPPRSKAKPKKPAAAPARGFALSGHQTTWGPWRFHWSVTPREGLVLQDVYFGEGATARSVLGRASISETLLAYGDSARFWSGATGFEEGQRGLGQRALSLSPGLDVQEDALLLDAAQADEDGRARLRPRMVAFFERDAQRRGARRAKELVAAFKARSWGEDYLFQWVFDQDGRIEPQVEISGAPLRRQGLCGRHEHFFNYRLDFQVDGASNAVVELNDVGRAGGVMSQAAPLRTPRDAAREANPATFRRWVVASSTHAYELVPSPGATAWWPPDSQLRRRVPLLGKQFWATVDRPGELYAAGDYPGPHGRPGGVDRWSRHDESLEGEGVVVWYTLSVPHEPGPADWPAERSQAAGFAIVPSVLPPVAPF